VKYALVTGASGGLGAALAAELLATGAFVALGVRDGAVRPVAAELTAAHPERARVLHVDYTEPDSLATLATRCTFPRLDMLVNCGGVNVAAGQPAAASKGPLPDLDYGALIHVFATNVAGPVTLCRVMLPLLATGRGMVVNVSTQRASLALTDQPGSFSYAVSKAALNMASRKLAAELGPAGITVVAIDPGWIRTRMGGPDAPRAPAEAARQMLSTLLDPGRSLNGRFVTADGKDLPW
jgi:NAD(P)-dependent dehydrogenase (short-subunit alcohol dehydrogenase family)